MRPSVPTIPTPPDDLRNRPGAEPSTGRELRVLVVAESFLPQVNGVTNSVVRVLDHLATTGHAAAAVAPTGPESYAGFPVLHTRGANLPFYRDFRVGLQARGRFREIIAAFEPDVLHVASPAALGYQAVRAADELGIPTVAIYQTDLVGFARQYGVLGGEWAMARLTRAIHRRVDRTLAPSAASLRQLEALGVPRLALWPRGVDTTLFHPARRTRPVAGDQPVRIGYVGRLAAEKELHLLRSVADLPGTELVLVGAGPEEEWLRSLLPSAQFRGLVLQGELAQEYADLDVFVHTGRYETYCQSAQEALASGVPVVAPRAGGPVDVVPPDAGRLYQPGDGAALRGHVAALVEDPALRARMGAAGRRAVEGRTWTRVNDLLLEHYREVIGARENLGAA
ncbi:MAG TPA: glycosyltransferase family 1 protein [Nocardioides sp.]|jgi:phosphatidylinositol alpha 1,6-mannosyltransferase|uniref:glycosyltransferase family 4 protein n=1 Tax=Nocardioides sp. TaxID=35761 RepID=UPI002E309590|nr:glycosyltransferase family 1 protein [Nocardioides sp.]HEX3931011.1 glycosyltransferase family 1 protein [Nocardioides sp.]